ncbi:MAG: CorA family divalent cation transporter [Candidatus Competibacter sp.]
MARPNGTVNLIRYRAAVRGLICGFAMQSGRCSQPLAGEELNAALAQPDAVVWLHFNLRIGQARDWIAGRGHLPETSRRLLLDDDDRKRIERGDRHLIGVISDIRYDFGVDFDPDQIAALRFHLDSHHLISARRQPCSAADQLRTEIGAGRTFESAPGMMVRWFEWQVSRLGDTTLRIRGRLDDIEEQILTAQVWGQHARLGGIRRLAVRLNHHFGPEYRMLQRLSRQPPDWFPSADHAALAEVVEDFRELVADWNEAQERAKLLQEELAARLAEQTNRNLYILSLFTALLLPPSVIAGIFGMNVAGLPGLQEGAAFWWVIFGMVGVCGLILLALYWRRLF